MKVLVLLFLFSISVRADEFYLKNPPSYRYLGNDQGNVGSCQAEADVTALENIFWHKGYAVQLSTFYRHAFNWQKDTETPEGLAADLKLRIDTEDRQILSQMGGVVPYFMLPDNREGYDPAYTGMQPHLKDIIVKDPSYKPFNVTRTNYPLDSRFTGNISVDQLKNFIQEGRALSFSLPGSFLMGGNFDNYTGMMNRNVDVLQFAKGKTTHSVAIVGYDDSLYTDYGFSRAGAIIIKNSWEDDGRRRESLDNAPGEYSIQEALHNMKYKISPNQVLPGYFAIPYEFLLKSSESPEGFNVREYTMDFAGFAAQYEQLKPQYKVVTAPFICGTDTQDSFPSFKNRGFKTAMTFGNTLLELMRPSLPEDERKTKTNVLMTILNIQTQERQDAFKNMRIPQFSFAKFSQNKSLGIDRVQDFYNGKFNDYFCFPDGASEMNAPRFLYPNINHYQKPSIQKSLDDLSVSRHATVNWWNFLRELYVMEVNHEISKFIDLLN